MPRSAVLVLSLLTAASTSPTAAAGPYSDDLGKCLVSSTTAQDKTDFVEWIFFALSLNPKISQYSNVSAPQREATDRKLAALFEKLLTVSCSEPAKAAVKYEGTAAITESFKLLGQVAAQEIFGDPAVAAATSGFTQYLDEKKFQQALGLPADKK